MCVQWVKKRIKDRVSFLAWGRVKEHFPRSYSGRDRALLLVTSSTLCIVFTPTMNTHQLSFSFEANLL